MASRIVNGTTSWSQVILPWNWRLKAVERTTERTTTSIKSIMRKKKKEIDCQQFCDIDRLIETSSASYSRSTERITSDVEIVQDAQRDSVLAFHPLEKVRIDTTVAVSGKTPEATKRLGNLDRFAYDHWSSKINQYLCKLDEVTYEIRSTNWNRLEENNR